MMLAEGEYVNLSNAVYAWQSVEFLTTISRHRCVFVGTSFTDPNLRKWLAFVHEGMTAERSYKNWNTERRPHFWLEKRPTGMTPREAEHLQELVEDSVAHLGVTVVWLDSWDQIEEQLSPSFPHKNRPGISRELSSLFGP